MSNTIFSTVDRFTSRFKLVDNLINSVAERLLPQHEAEAGPGCPPGTYYTQQACGDYCLPTSDLRYELIYFCNPDPSMSYIVRQCCDCCG